MDDLDRLAFRLVRTARDSYPQLLAHGFSLADIEERLLPFREARREMADGGAIAWETTVLRLLSGEREYIAAEPALQAACREALRHPSPSVSLVRGWATATLMLGRGSLRAGGDVAASTVTVAASPVTGSSITAVATARALPVRGCRYCGGRLPDGRRITFCPHCGLDLTKRKCQACSTELEMAWRFCVTCGRGAEGAIDERPRATGTG